MGRKVDLKVNYGEEVIKVKILIKKINNQESFLYKKMHKISFEFTFLLDIQNKINILHFLRWFSQNIKKKALCKLSLSPFEQLRTLNLHYPLFYSFFAHSSNSKLIFCFLYKFGFWIPNVLEVLLNYGELTKQYDYFSFACSSWS